MASQTGSATGNTLRRLRPWAVIRAAIWGISCILFVVNLRSNPTDESESAYPLKPITVIVPFNTGGESDAFARMIQHAASQHKLLGQELVIQNIGGAGATIGSGRARKADPDGYTMMILHEALLTAQSSGKVSYGAESFEPIAATGKTRLIIAVRDDSPYQTLSEIMAAAAETPDQLVFAANLGAPVHYAGLILERQLPGSAFRYTQTGGGAQRFEAVVGGHADVSAFSLGEYIAYKAGGLRAIAISAPQRDPRVPEILTAREQGFDFVHANMHFWWFPKGTDQAKIDRIAKFLEDCMETDIVQNQLATRLSDPLILTGDKMHSELADRISKIQSVDSASPDVLPNVPLIILTATGLCLVGMLLPMLRLFLGTSRGSNRQAKTEMEDVEPPMSGNDKRKYWATAAKVAVLTVLYVLSLEYLPVDYRWLTMGFICLFGVVIGSGVVAQPQMQQPLATNPPMQQPTNPPMQQPLAANPPMQQPLAANPPMQQPVATNPPMQQPLAANPPMQQPLAANPPMQQPNYQQPAAGIQNPRFSGGYERKSAGIVFRRLRPLPIFLDVVVLVPFWIYAVFQSGLNIELP